MSEQLDWNGVRQELADRVVGSDDGAMLERFAAIALRELLKKVDISILLGGDPRESVTHLARRLAAASLALAVECVISHDRALVLLGDLAKEEEFRLKKEMGR